MKKLVLALFATAVFCSLYAKVYEWPQLPDAALPDTEVVTNVALWVNVERLDVFSLKLEIYGTGASSEVLVAIGHDADENGDLSFEETAFAFGCDGGERYLVNHQTGRVFTGVGDTFAVSHRHFDPAWNLVKVVKRGEGAVGETVTEIVENKRFSIRIR